MKIQFKLILLILCLLLMISQAWGQASSTNYKLIVGTPVSGGGSSVSANYGLAGAFPMTTGGGSDSPNYILTGGAPATIVTSSLTAAYGGGPVQTVVIENQSLEVEYSTTEAQAFGTFYYRLGGNQAFTGANMTQGAGNTLTYTVSSSLLTARGLEFYFEIEDGQNFVNVGFPGEPYIFRVHMQTNSQGLSPTALPEASYRIIGVPINPTAPNIESVFSDDFGPVDNKEWRLGRYRQSEGSVVPYPSAGSVLPGRAFWAIARGGKSFGTPGRSVVPNEEYAGSRYYRIALDSGWNQVANPFAFDITWGNVIFDSSGTILPHASAVVENAAYSYNGSSYTSTQIIRDWEGVFIKATVPGIVAMIPYEVHVTKAAMNQAPVAEWQLHLKLKTPYGLIDDQNFAGVHIEAREGVDKFDFSEPPPPPGGPSLAFNSEAYSSSKRVDIRPEFVDGAVWNLTIDNAPAGSELSILNLREIPVGMEAWIKRNNDLIRIEDESALILNGTERQLQLIIGTPAYLEKTTDESLPLTFELNQNYPNPFNPATNISFSLPEPGYARLEIFNLLGQRVITLIDENLSAGKYNVPWNSSDEHGLEVGSGVYFYKLTYGEYSEQRKMMLLK